MNRPFRALLWDQWINSRLPLACMGLVLVLAMAIGGIITYWDRTVMGDDFVAMLWLLAFCTIFISFASGTVRDVRLDFPRRLFSLPVSSTQLFWGQWTFKMLVALACGILVGVGQGIFGDWDQYVFLPASVFALVVSTAQMFACFATALGAMRAVLLFVTLYIGTVLLVREIKLEDRPPTHIAQRTDPTIGVVQNQNRIPSGRRGGRGAPTSEPQLSGIREASEHANAISAEGEAARLQALSTRRGRRMSEQQAFAAAAKLPATPVVTPQGRNGDRSLLGPETARRLRVLAISLGIFSGTVLVSWWITCRMRSGLLLGRIPMLDKEVTVRQRKQGRFKSPQAAQRWFEWRSTLQYGLWASAAFAVIAALAIAVVEAASVLVLLFPYFQVAIVLGIGYYMTVGTIRHRTFVFTKPLGSAPLARARIRAGLVYVTVITGFWLIGIIVAGNLVSTQRFLPELISEVVPLLALLCTVGVFAALMVGREMIALAVVAELALVLIALPLGLLAMWLGAPEDLAPAGGLLLVCIALLALWFVLNWRGLPGGLCLYWMLVGTGLAILLGAGIFATGADLLETHFPSQSVIAMTPLVLLPYALAAGIYAEARARRLIPALFFTHPVAILMFGGLACTWIPFAVKEYLGVASDDLTGFAFVLASACLAAFAWVPMFTQWQRHR